jgi:hypothetical protein
VVVPRGGWGSSGCNVNVLTKALVTVVGMGTPYYETRVDLAKLEAFGEDEPGERAKGEAA